MTLQSPCGTGGPCLAVLSQLPKALLEQQHLPWQPWYTWTVLRVSSDTGFCCLGWKSLVPAWHQAASLVVVTCARVCCANKVS